MPDPGGPDPPAALHHRVSAVPELVTAVRRSLAAWARNAGLATEVAEAVTLAAYEAMANAVDHAYRDGDPGSVDIHATVSGGRAVVVVSDRGRWRPPPPARDHRSDRLSGRGLPLIHGLSDNVAITGTDEGTTVRMSWTLS